MLPAKNYIGSPPLPVQSRLNNKRMLLRKNILIVTILLIASFAHLKAQKVDSIFFNLYTDSLKKGTYNYINVDGKMSNGTWVPLTAKELNFTASAGRFDQNSLVLEKDFKEEKVTITASLKTDPTKCKTVTIYIKKNPDNEKLKTEQEVLKELEEQSRQKQKKSTKNKSR